MRKRLLLTAMVCAAMLAAGCDKERQHLRLRSRESTYRSWLLIARPYLASLKAPELHHTEFNTLEYASTVQPVIDYELKAGDWDGVLSLSYVLETDSSGAPTGIREENVSFIALPSKERFQDGRHLRVSYSGLKFPASAAKSLFDRVVRGDSFQDLLRQTEAKGRPMISRYEDTDSWRALPTKHVWPAQTEREATPSGRRIRVITN